jgi:hypothetical protein
VENVIGAVELLALDGTVQVVRGTADGTARSETGPVAPAYKMNFTKLSL